MNTIPPEDATPRRIVMYTLAAGTPGDVTPIAEFTYTPGHGVTYTELEPRWTRPARHLRDHGITPLGADTPITTADGPAFMNALLEPSRTSMYGFVDKTGQ